MTQLLIFLMSAVVFLKPASSLAMGRCEHLFIDAQAMAQLLNDDYLQFRGVVGGRFIDGVPTVMVTNRAAALSLPRSTYAGKLVRFKTMKPMRREGKGAFSATIEEARVAKSELKNYLESLPDSNLWIRGIGLTGGPEKFSVLVRVSDPDAFKFVPNPFRGKKIVVELGEILIRFPQKESSLTLARRTQLRAIEEFKSLPGFQKVAIVGGRESGYYLELQLSQPPPPDLGGTFENLILDISFPGAP